MSIEGILIGLVAILVGAGWAFYGLRFFTIILPIWALFFGFVTGVQWGQDVFGQGFLGTVTSWIIGGVLALVLAALSYFWYYFAVTLAVGALGYTLGVGLMDVLGIDASILGIIVGLIVGAVFAIGTFLLGVPAVLIVLVSAISGAAAMVNGALILLGRIKVEDLDSGLLSGLLTDSLIGVVAWGVIAVVAAFYQLRGVERAVEAVSRSAYRY
jgi:hypothetical protein